MAKVKVSEWSATPGSNTDIDGINIAEGCSPSGINDAIREMMSQIKGWQSGASGDSLTIGAAGTLTLSGGTANGIPYLNGSKVLTSGSALTFDGTNLSLSGNLITQTSSAATAAGQWGYNSTYGSYIYAKGGTTANFAIFTNSGGNGVLMDSSGNLGLGVTPSAGASWVNFQTQRAVFTGGANDRNEFSYNSYRTPGQYTYIGSDYASIYQQTSGQHRWFTAPSGTAGNAITFTQAMTLDASGNLLVGTTSAFGKLTVAQSGTGTAADISTTNASTTYVASLYRPNNGTMVAFNNNGSIVGSISVTTTTAYNTSSDYRLKENIQPMVGALAKIQALKPVTYTWKADGSAGEGFIAHELAEVCPQAVTGEKDGMRTEQYEISPAVPAVLDEEGNELTPAVEAVMGERQVPAYQGIDVSFLVGTLTAAIQELKAEFDAYKAAHP